MRSRQIVSNLFHADGLGVNFMNVGPRAVLTDPQFLSVNTKQSLRRNIFDNHRSKTMTPKRNGLPMETAETDESNDNDSNEEDHPEIEKESTSASSNAPKKIKKRGIIYLSTIPKYMNVIKIRETFSIYGKVGRIYLQLANTDTNVAKKKKPRKVAAKHFTEGWVEFESKKVAKYVAATLNNTQISTQKKSKFYDLIWNIKYLPRFKWIHLSERLAYERAVHKQRLNADIAQAKREVNFFSHNVDRSKKLRNKEQRGESSTFVAPEIKQRDTEMEIINRKKITRNDDRTDFLKSLFS